MSRYIEQEHIEKTVSNLPTEVFQTENRIELVLSATEVIDAIKDAPSIDIVRCGECKKWHNGWCYKYSRAFEPNDFCSRGERNCSEKPNNCEHITEDGVTCAKYPAYLCKVQVGYTIRIESVPLADPTEQDGWVTWNK